MGANTGKRSHVRLPREQRMRDIEAAAKITFCRDGYDVAAVNEIASLAGVSEGSIYKFYDSKRDLLHSILKHWYRNLIDDLEAKLQGVEGVRPKLHLVIWQHLNSIKNDPGCCRLFFSEVRSTSEYDQTELYSMNKRYTHILTEIIQNGIEAGEIKEKVSVGLVRDLIYGGIEHRVSPYLAGKGELDCDKIGLQLSEIIFGGILCSRPTNTELSEVFERLSRIEGKGNE